MSALPASIRDPAISRLTHRANQLRTAAPAISYWLEYHALDQIISRSLHTTDEESLAWTTTLMDRLETTKNAHADDDAFTDDDAGRAVVEEFANNAFARGEKALRANRVTIQTADTFDAAATFLSLPSIWGPIDETTKKKILFCKWNASRILKAIRNGEDPNDSNPVLDDSAEAEPAPVADDAELEAGLAAAAAASEGSSSSAPRPVTVEDADDPDIELPDTLLPSVPSEVRPREVIPTPEPGPPSPLSATDGQWPSNGAVSESVSPALSPAVMDTPGTNSGPCTPAFDLLTSTTQSSAPSIPPTSSSTPTLPAPIIRPPPVSRPSDPTYTPYAHAPVPRPAPPISKPLVVPTPNYDAGEIDVARAQKHAKWAISALNFDDVPTAVQELQNALRVLGAQ